MEARVTFADWVGRQDSDESMSRTSISVSPDPVAAMANANYQSWVSVSGVAL
jgi:hypothetical protein